MVIIIIVLRIIVTRKQEMEARGSGPCCPYTPWHVPETLRALPVVKGPVSLARS